MSQDRAPLLDEKKSPAPKEIDAGPLFILKSGIVLEALFKTIEIDEKSIAYLKQCTELFEKTSTPGASQRFAIVGAIKDYVLHLAFQPTVSADDTHEKLKMLEKIFGKNKVVRAERVLTGIVHNKTIDLRIEEASEIGKLFSSSNVILGLSCFLDMYGRMKLTNRSTMNVNSSGLNFVAQRCFLFYTHINEYDPERKCFKTKRDYTSAFEIERSIELATTKFIAQQLENYFKKNNLENIQSVKIDCPNLEKVTKEWESIRYNKKEIAERFLETIYITAGLEDGVPGQFWIKESDAEIIQNTINKANELKIPLDLNAKPARLQHVPLSALELAATKGSLDVVVTLVENGCKITADSKKCDDGTISLYLSICETIQDAITNNNLSKLENINADIEKLKHSLKNDIRMLEQSKQRLQALILTTPEEKEIRLEMQRKMNKIDIDLASLKNLEEDNITNIFDQPICGGMTPLSIALTNKNFELLSTLIDNYIYDPDTLDTLSKKTPLYTAAQQQNYSILIKLLLRDAHPTKVLSHPDAKKDISPAIMRFFTLTKRNRSLFLELFNFIGKEHSETFYPILFQEDIMDNFSKISIYADYSLDLLLLKVLQENKDELIEFILSKELTLNPKLPPEIKPLILAAVESGKINIVKKLIDAKLDVNEERRGLTALHIAIQKNDIPLINLLLKSGATSTTNNDPIYQTLSPIRLAIQQGNLSIVKLLLDEYKAVNAYNADQVIEFAITEKQMEITHYLLNRPGIDISNYLTAYNIAIQTANLTLFKELITQKINLDDDILLEDSIILAVKHGSEAIFDLLFELKSEKMKQPILSKALSAATEAEKPSPHIVSKILKQLEVIDSHQLYAMAANDKNINLIKLVLESREFKAEDYTTLLFEAVKNDAKEITTFLLESKKVENINVRDAEDISLLEHAATTGNTPILKELLKHGASISAEENKIDALIIAAKNYNIDSMEILLKNGADPTRIITYNKMDCTVLDLILLEWYRNPSTLRNLQTKIIELLLQSDIALEQNQYSAILLAAHLDNADIMDLLLPKITDRNSPDFAAAIDTSLEIAIKNLNEDLIKTLVNHGATINESILCQALEIDQKAQATRYRGNYGLQVNRVKNITPMLLKLTGKHIFELRQEYVGNESIQSILDATYRNEIIKLRDELIEEIKHSHSNDNNIDTIINLLEGYVSDKEEQVYSLIRDEKFSDAILSKMVNLAYVTDNLSIAKSLIAQSIHSDHPSIAELRKKGEELDLNQKALDSLYPMSSSQSSSALLANTLFQPEPKVDPPESPSSSITPGLGKKSDD